MAKWSHNTVVQGRLPGAAHKPRGAPVIPLRPKPTIPPPKPPKPPKAA